MSWGDPLVIRQALVETLGNDYLISKINLESVGYPPHLGSPKLIEQMKDLEEMRSGYRPKHLMVTCGGTGAISAALYALDNIGIEYIVTNNRYYPIYPSIIGVQDKVMITEYKRQKINPSNKSIITLVDSPSAPEGLIYPFRDVDIWDAAYATRTYGCKLREHKPSTYRIMCGSLSKTLGLAGLRLGWVSTNDDDLAHSLSIYVTASYVGLSKPSMDIAEQILENVDLDSFEYKAANYLNDNRNEMQKVLTKFGQGNVPSRGMFALLELGKVERKALERANVKWLPGSQWGEDDNWARLSLGPYRETVRDAVRAILR